MAFDTGGRDLTVFCLVFLLHVFVATLTIFVKGEFQIELLLVLGEFLFAFNRRFIMALHALLNLVAFFPGVFAVLIDVMALVALDFVFILVLLVIEIYRALGVLRPKLGLYVDHFGRFLFGGATQTQESHTAHQHRNR
jgi:hypothetical protein